MLARLLIALTLMGLVGTAFADTPAGPVTGVRELVAKADADYKAGKYVEALDGYSRAYEQYPVAPLLFNIGQSHKNLGQHEQAILFFEKYLAAAPTAANRGLVEDLLRESRTELDKQKAAQLEKDRLEKERLEKELREKERLEKERLEKERLEREARASRRPILEYSLIGGGAAFTIAGGAFFYYGTKRGGPEEKYVYDDTRLLGGALMFTGVAAAAVGTYMLLHKSSSGPVMAVGAQGAYVGWGGTL